MRDRGESATPGLESTWSRFAGAQNYAEARQRSTDKQVRGTQLRGCYTSMRATSCASAWPSISINYQALVGDALSSARIHLDETRWRMLGTGAIRWGTTALFSLATTQSSSSFGIIQFRRFYASRRVEEQVI
jgi:hypothetical protein